MSMAVREFRVVHPADVRSRPVRGGARPANGAVVHRSVPHAVSPAPHPLRRGERPGFQVTLAAALLTAVAVVGLLGLAHLRAPDVPSSPATSVVQVRGGESLSDVAARVSPDQPVGAVVQRIIDLNGMSVADLHPGQSLVVPATYLP